jgi:photosystem II stability/assembly factor-like uncharacterized protein
MKHNLIVLAFLFFSSLAQSQNGWEVYNDFSNVQSIKFTNVNTGWASGNTGMIMKTSNGGNNWTYQANPSTGNLNNIAVLSPNVCIITGTGGEILRTSNGGAVWTRIVSSAANVYSICFFDYNNGWISADSSMLKTTDSGLNWITISGFPKSFVQLKFFSAVNGIALSSAGSFCKTSNGGINWSEISLPYPEMKYFSFPDEMTGYCTGNLRVLKTTNGGITWTSVYFTNADWYGFEFLNANTGYGADANRKIFKTTDGGLNWSEKFSGDGSNYNINCITILDANNIISGSLNRKIIKSSNGGSNWCYVSANKIDLISDLVDLSFSDENNGYLLGNQNNIYRTTNNGNDWTLLNTNNSIAPSALWFVNAYTGFITRSNSGITNSPLIKTTNGGLNWIGCADINSMLSESIFFLNQNTGWIGGEKVDLGLGLYQGVTYRTTNAGLNWTSSATFSSDIAVNNVFFADELRGWAASFNYTTSGGNIWKTTNGGNSYQNSLYFNPAPNSVCFGDVNNGYAVGGCYIHKSTNGGGSWTTTTFTGCSFYDVKFVNSNTGWICGGPKILLKTTNQGLNWNNVELGTGDIFMKMKFINENTGYILSHNGTVYKTTNSGTSFISNLSNQTAENFYLKQNFPNPFNNSTQIVFGIKNAGLCKIRIYDITGKLISEILNERMNSGEYKVNFNSGNLSSGVYFYVLAISDLSGNFGHKEIKRMVLVK